MPAGSTMYERVGGDAFFDDLTRTFYEAVETDSVLRPLYPKGAAGLERSRVHLRDFLIQFWGGPSVYRETRGEPRLARRHARFAIGQAERDAWLSHMTDAMRAAGLRPLDEAQMLSHFRGSADTLVNRPST
ncbi:MAG: globin [Acidimicrobiales bacterium]